MSDAPLAPQIPDAATFGGPFINHDEVVNPQTEMDARFFNRLIDQVVMLSHVRLLAWARCTVSAPDVSVVAHSAVWGNTSGVAPQVTRHGVGDYSVEWADSYQGLDTSVTPAPTRAVQIQGAEGSGHKAGAARIINFIRASAVRIDVKAYDAAGAPAELDEFLVKAL